MKHFTGFSQAIWHKHNSLIKEQIHWHTLRYRRQKMSRLPTGHCLTEYYLVPKTWIEGKVKQNWLDINRNICMRNTCVRRNRQGLDFGTKLHSIASSGRINLLPSQQRQSIATNITKGVVQGIQSSHDPFVLILVIKKFTNKYFTN